MKKSDIHLEEQKLTRQWEGGGGRGGGRGGRRGGGDGRGGGN